MRELIFIPLLLLAACSPNTGVEKDLILTDREDKGYKIIEEKGDYVVLETELEVNSYGYLEFKIESENLNSKPIVTLTNPNGEKNEQVDGFKSVYDKEDNMYNISVSSNLRYCDSDTGESNNKKILKTESTS